MTPALTAPDLIVAVFAMVVVPALSAWSGWGLARTPPAERRLAGRYAWIIVRSAIAVIAIGALWFRLGRPFAALGFDIPVGRGGRIGFGVDAAVLLYYLYAIKLRQRSDDDLRHARERLRGMGSDRLLPQSRLEQLLYPWMAIAGSTFEELVYRGFLIWLLTPAVGVFGAVVVSAISFGVGHVYLGRIGVARTTGIGLLLASAYVATDSLWWLIVAHATVNLFGLPLQRRLLSAEGIQAARQ